MFGARIVSGLRHLAQTHLISQMCKGVFVQPHVQTVILESLVLLKWGKVLETLTGCSVQGGLFPPTSP